MTSETRPTDFASEHRPGRRYRPRPVSALTANGPHRRIVRRLMLHLGTLS
jgi:hypothetical protein